MCPESTWAESAVHDNKSVHVCCALLPCQVPLSSHAVSRPDKRRVIHDRESCRPMSSTSLVSRSTVSQHACPCSCLVSVTRSLSLFLAHRAVQVPRVVLSKNLAPELCLRDFSASRTARLRDVDWSRLCRIQHGVRVVGFVLSTQNPAAP